MDYIDVITSTSSMARMNALAFIKGGFVPESYSLKYNTSAGLPHIEFPLNYHSDKYGYVEGAIPDNMFPLIIEGHMTGHKWAKIKLRVYSVTAGYGGEGPRDLRDLLKGAGFPIDEEAICTQKWVVDDTISFEGDMTGMKKTNF